MWGSTRLLAQHSQPQGLPSSSSLPAGMYLRGGTPLTHVCSPGPERCPWGQAQTSGHWFQPVVLC